MLLTSIDLYHIALPLRRSMATPLGTRETLETVIVALHGDGGTGWSEASPGNAPLRNAEWAAGAFGLLRDWVAPAVVGKTINSGDDLAEILKPFHGNQHAKAAIDGAWWDLNARRQNRPLHQLLAGEKARETIEVMPTFDRMDSPDDLAAAVSRAVEAGFSRVKLKFRPGWDVRMVEFVRKEFPTLDIHVDCEAGLTLGQTDLLFRLEDFMPTMIEQPLAADDLIGHAMLQESLRTPIALDESIASVAQAEMALELKSCKYVNLKPGRVGGLTSAVAIHDLCRAGGISCWVGAGEQSAVGCRTYFALAAKENCEYPSDFFAADRFLADDIAEPLTPAKDSDGRQRVRLSASPGIGVEPDRAKLEKYCISRAGVE